MNAITTHKVALGDTIQSIGQRYSVDWTTIATTNDLQYPYVDAYGLNSTKPNVAKVGDTLLIPNSKSNFKSLSSTSNSLENQVFGKDLDIYSSLTSSHGVINLDDTGELSSNDQGDLTLSEGLRNLRQQLTSRLGVQKGSLLLHPEFGSNILSYIGLKITKELLVKIRLEVQECLLGDFRVKGVSNITAKSQKNTIYVECLIHPIEPYSTFKLSKIFSKT